MKKFIILILLNSLCIISFEGLLFGELNSYTTSLKDEAINYRRKGYEAQMLGNLDFALSCYQKAIQLDPYYVSCYNDLGVVYEMKGWPDRAEEVYLKAIQLDPNYLPSYSNLALLYEKKNDALKAAEFWGKRIQLGLPGELWVQKAKERLKALRIISPELMREFLEEEAAELSKRILEEKKERERQRLAKVKEHFNLGMSCYLKGNYEEAKEELYEASILDPENPEIRKFLDKSTFKSNQINVKKYAESGIRAYSERNYLSAIKEFEKILTLIQSETKSK